MAILVEEKGQGGGRFKILILVVAAAALVAGTYYLFFAPTPFIEVIVPTELESISKISESGLNASLIFNSPVYQSLRPYASEIEVGEVGRSNPFQPF